MTNTYCIECGSTRIYRSRRRGRIEHVVTVLGGRIRRCHGCNTRFLQLGGALIRTNRLGHFGQRLLLAAGMTVAATALLFAILWFGRSESIRAPFESGSVAPATIHARLGTHPGKGLIS